MKQLLVYVCATTIGMRIVHNVNAHFDMETEETALSQRIYIGARATQPHECVVRITHINDLSVSVRVTFFFVRHCRRFISSYTFCYTIHMPYTTTIPNKWNFRIKVNTCSVSVNDALEKLVTRRIFIVVDDFLFCFYAR